MDQLNILDARIPKWDLNNLSERNCPFCGSKNDAVISRPDKLQLSYCDICGCWYVSTLPTESSIVDFYNGYFYSHRQSELSKSNAIQMLKNAKCAGKSEWRLQTLNKILNGLHGKRILEAGCGLCSFLLSARAEGAEVTGCDLSPEACDFAQNQLGIEAHCSTLESCIPNIGKVDAVIMKDFIEHPIDPLTVINAAYSVLKPEGVLLLHTPNGGEAGRSVEIGKEWVGFRVDLEHLQYLSPRTVNWIAQKNYMHIERLETFGLPGLKGLSELPARNYRKPTQFVKNLIRKIPLVPIVTKTLHFVKAEMASEQQDPRLGSYHLFAVLRKQ
jgi:2-polyprenyl-3-methyl-5-hydroxy-6-metoxy-1,4-benzoquinol methylase